MLEKLYIKNYILIDELEVDFSAGMNVITGETGAGKSIIIDAISLLLGERSSVPSPVHEDQKTIMEGSFQVSGENESELRDIFQKNNWDWENPVIIRKEYTPQGKSRMFVNDSPVRQKDIQSISPYLIELHQQFDHLSVRSEAFQLKILDALANRNSEALPEYRSIYTQWSEAVKTLKKLKENAAEAQKDRDYKQFIYEELFELNLQAGEIESLDEKVKLGQNTEDIVSYLQSALYRLSEADENISSQLKSTAKDISTHSKHLSKLQEIADRINSAAIEIDDVSSEITDIAESIEWNEEDMHLWTERLDAGNRLLSKHQLRTTEELIDLRSRLEEELDMAQNSDEAITELETKISAMQSRLEALADEITLNRKSAVPDLSSQLHTLLAKVGMDKAQMQVDIEETELNPNGKDKVSFMLDANRTGRFETIGKAASGGELNRLMLALKSIIAENLSMPTLIFDEIDSGISGEPARQVGLLMKKLSDKHQVITITHQASIAALGQKHWFIYKSPQSSTDSLQTQIRSITGQDREQHIAELIGGIAGGDSALAAAKKLLSESI